ncbi:MAG: DNA topoisomerase [Nanoarchaeota archaeon]
MPIKDFVPLSDVKQTVEKLVAEKIPMEDRIKVEKPGKPVPADILESGGIEKKPKRKTKKASSSEGNVSIKPAKKEYTLIITEKPQAAQKIANALGESKKYTEAGVSYYEVEKSDEKIVVASAVGHLFGLEYKKGQKGWPIFEVEWKPSYTEKHAAFTKKYYDLLKILARGAHTFIIATDYDVEGEVIGWNVLRFLCGQKTAKRMKFSTLTSDELKSAYENPEAHPNWGNAYAGESRHIIDWLYGINLSRALMSAIKTTGSFKILSIGRVQGPALKIIVDREKQINDFKSEPFWQVFADINWKVAGLLEPAGGCRFKHPEDIFDKKILDKFKKIKEANAETKKSEEKTSPPVPFDLTTLQREAYRFLKISPSETLATAQKLYLEGIISYPRTSSQKIPEQIEPKKILKKLSSHFPEVKLATRITPIEGKKSDPAHPSIYPTGEFKSLEGREEKLYNLIVKRFISAFSPDLVTANKRISLTALDSKGNPIKYTKLEREEIKIEDELETIEEKPKEREVTIRFNASAQTILDKGWTAVYHSDIQESELPDLNEKVKIEKIDIQEKQTSPPSRFSPTSLVTILERKNLGTKATRSMIVDTLFNRGYLDGKSIQATPLGMKLIEALDKHSPIIIDENLTRHLEEEMQNIQESKEDFQKKEDSIVNKAKKIITDISKEFKLKEKEIGEVLKEGLTELRKEQQEANTLQQCPTCKKGNLRIMFNRLARRYFVSCSAYPDCRQTYSLPPNALIRKIDNKICEADNFPKLLAIRKAKRPWEFCFNPECPIEKEKRDAYEAKKNSKEE